MQGRGTFCLVVVLFTMLIFLFISGYLRLVDDGYHWLFMFSWVDCMILLFVYHIQM